MSRSSSPPGPRPSGLRKGLRRGGAEGRQVTARGSADAGAPSLPRPSGAPCGRVPSLNLSQRERGLRGSPAGEGKTSRRRPAGAPDGRVPSFSFPQRGKGRRGRARRDAPLQGRAPTRVASRDDPCRRRGLRKGLQRGKGGGGRFGGLAGVPSGLSPAGGDEREGGGWDRVRGPRRPPPRRRALRARALFQFPPEGERFKAAAGGRESRRRRAPGERSKVRFCGVWHEVGFML